VRPRSVLQVFQPLEGGVPEHVVHLAEGIPAHGWEVEVAAPVGTPFLAPLRRTGVRVNTLPMTRSPQISDLRAARALRDLDKNRAFSVVHAHSSKAGVLVRTALPDRHRLVYTPHCFSFLGGFRGLERLAYRAVEQVLLPRTGALIAASDWERDQALTQLRGAASRTRVIKYGVPACDGQPASQELLAFKGKHTLAGTICRLEPQKDPMALLRAAAILRGRGVDTLRLAIVGNGSLWSQLQAEVDKHGLSKLVRLFPFRGSIGSYLAALDLFVLPSLWESLPIGILEAMACRLPVLASDICGTPEAVRDGVTGRLVPPAQADALATVLEEMASDPHRLAELGRAGLRSAQSDFSEDRMILETVLLYEALLAEATSSPNTGQKGCHATPKSL
jgi:glycosyltransferase involved in cell wall biosynthesis